MRLYGLIGPARFEPRFALFRSLEANGLLPPFARDNHPVEYGVYLCVEHPEAVEQVPAGYLAWADHFAFLVEDFRRRHTKRDWKALRGDILSGFGVAEGGNQDSLNAVFLQLRFGWIFGPGGTVAPAPPGCELILGRLGGVTADYVLRTPRRRFGIDCKSLRNGPMRSNWDHHLERALLTNPSVQRFLATGSGVALATAPRLDFLLAAAGATGFAADIDELLADRGAGRRVLIAGEFSAGPPQSPDAVREFVANSRPPGHSERLISCHAASGHGASSERPAYIACYTQDDPAAFAGNVQRAATKVLTKQAAPDGPAIVAFNLDYLTAVRANQSDPEEARRAARADALYNVQRALLADEVCRRLYGVLFWFDPHLQSSEAWTTDIGVELVFWRNSQSPFHEEPVPPPFNRIAQLTLEPD